jgi:hypothetical protein
VSHQNSVPDQIPLARQAASHRRLHYATTAVRRMRADRHNVLRLSGDDREANVVRCRRVLSEASAEASSQARPRATATTARIHALSLVRMPAPRNDRAQTRPIPDASLIEARCGAALSARRACSSERLATTRPRVAAIALGAHGHQPTPEAVSTTGLRRRRPASPATARARQQPCDTTTARQGATAGLGEATTPLARRRVSCRSPAGWRYQALAERNQRARPRAPRLRAPAQQQRR